MSNQTVSSISSYKKEHMKFEIEMLINRLIVFFYIYLTLFASDTLKISNLNLKYAFPFFLIQSKKGAHTTAYLFFYQDCPKEKKIS